MLRRVAPALFVSFVIACGLDEEGAHDPSANAGSGGHAASSNGGVGGGSGGTSAGTGGGAGSSGGVSGAAGQVSGGAAGIAGAGGAGEAGSPSGGGGGVVSQTIEITASVADCIALNAPNPDTCLAVYPTELHVDVSAVYLADSPSAAYLRFDVGNEIAGATLTAVELVLENVNGSSMSGAVRQVTPFTRLELFGTAPPPGMVISSDLGPVNPGSVVWPLTLPPAPNQPYCVAVTTLTNDGIGYARLGGAIPPKLRLTFSK